jgi:hypothetical protein
VKVNLLLEAKYSTIRRRTMTGMDRRSRNVHKEIKDYSDPTANESAIIATACATLRSNEKCWALFNSPRSGLLCFAQIVDAFLHRGYNQPFVPPLCTNWAQRLQEVLQPWHQVKDVAAGGSGRHRTDETRLMLYDTMVTRSNLFK